jgi:hypothetical protein
MHMSRIPRALTRIKMVGRLIHLWFHTKMIMKVEETYVAVELYVNFIEKLSKFLENLMFWSEKVQNEWEGCRPSSQVLTEWSEERSSSFGWDLQYRLLFHTTANWSWAVWCIETTTILKIMRLWVHEIMFSNFWSIFTPGRFWLITGSNWNMCTWFLLR